MAFNTAPLKDRQVQQSRLQTKTLPAPVGGINARVSYAQTPLDNCIYTYNIVPSEYGLRTRLGYMEHQVALTGTTVKTIIPYKGQAGSADKLFAATNSDISNITTQGGSPSSGVTFGTTTGAAGYASFIHFTNDAGADYILLADEVNGFYTYTASTDTWAASAALTYAAGTPPSRADIAFVVHHKQRVWLVEKATATGWYFGVGAITGDVTPFYFGGLFPQGGELVGLYNWSLDGGAGTDDILVAVSRAGDVVAFQGADPISSDTWKNIGTYNIGRVPAGRRIASSIEGDLHLLSVLGITSMSSLLKGVSADQDASNIGYKISRFLREAVKLNLDELGWEIKFFEDEGFGIINAPDPNSGNSTQMVVSLSTRGWGFWRGVNYFTAEMWNGVTYFALADDDVHFMTGSLDGVDENGAGGVEIAFSTLFAYSQLDAPGIFKQVMLLRPQFFSKIQPAFNVQARYDFDINEVVGSAPAAAAAAAVWDTAVWDSAIWAGALTGHNSVAGATGRGTWVSVAMNGSTTDRQTLISLDVVWVTDGIL